MKQKYDMHILHIIPGYGGGISSFVKSLAKGNINSNAVYDVISFTSYPKDFLEIIKNQHGNCYMLPNVYKHPLKNQIIILFIVIFQDIKALYLNYLLQKLKRELSCMLII